ncbi:tail assembly protein [Arenimonas sp.]|uniref:tail assembly protein n=1 Tax=Arenimonas sp. TaxID=1872635 RepID=UPI0025BE4F54|nr:tail assembly protein [Arenimonas sp.]
MLREVRLYGHLGARFGRVHRFDVATPAEALQALMANFRGFEDHLRRHNEPGYRVLTGKRPIMEVDELTQRRAGAEPIKIVPVVAGQKKGWGRILAGYVLIVVGTALSVLGYVPIGQALVQAGVALTLQGVVQLLTPVPKAPKPSERPENQPSYFFDGAVNTSAQGQCVPVLLGRLIVGSAVVSAGLSAEEFVWSQPTPPVRPPLPGDEDGKTGMWR